MLIIGHRGAKGLAPENTLEALHVGMNAGADMLEFDVRLTADKVPILCHNARIYGVFINQKTFAELQELGHITTLRSVLDALWGKVILNLQLKPMSDITIVYKLIAQHYVKHPEDWDNIIISSFWVKHLMQLRQLSPHVNLALLHHINPFAFMRYQRRLHLAAIGLHRLHVNPLALAVAKELGIFTYVYTVNRPQAAVRLEQKGIDGIVTDYPDKIRSVV